MLIILVTGKMQIRTTMRKLLTHYNGCKKKTENKKFW